MNASNQKEDLLVNNKNTSSEDVFPKFGKRKQVKRLHFEAAAHRRMRKRGGLGLLQINNGWLLWQTMRTMFYIVCPSVCEVVTVVCTCCDEMEDSLELGI